MRGIYNILLAFKNRVVNIIFNDDETVVEFTPGDGNTFDLTKNIQEF